MEHLRDGIGLRGYGQKDPKQEYKKEGYDIFVNMMASTSSSVCNKVFSVQVKKENEIERMEREDLERHNRAAQAMQMRHGSEIDGGDEAGGGGTPSGRPPAPAPPRGRAADQARRAEGREERPLPLRQRREVQEVPRGRPRRGQRRRVAVRDVPRGLGLPRRGARH